MDNGGAQAEARAALKPVLDPKHVYPAAATNSTPKGAQLPHSIAAHLPHNPRGRAAQWGGVRRMDNGGAQAEARAALKPVLSPQHIHPAVATDSTPKGAQLPHSITIAVTVAYPLGRAAQCGVWLGGQGGLTGCSGLRPGSTAVMLSCIRIPVTTCVLTPCPQPAYCSIACPGGNASMLHDTVHPCACGLACSESSHRLNCQDLNLD
jgi:hypothetical protein